MTQIKGQGSFGTVYVGISDTTKEKVAIKRLSKLKCTLFIYFLVGTN